MASGGRIRARKPLFRPATIAGDWVYAYPPGKSAKYRKNLVKVLVRKSADEHGTIVAEFPNYEEVVLPRERWTKLLVKPK